MICPYCNGRKKKANMIEIKYTIDTCEEDKTNFQKIQGNNLLFEFITCRECWNNKISKLMNGIKMGIVV